MKEEFVSKAKCLLQDMSSVKNLSIKATCYVTGIITQSIDFCENGIMTSIK